MLESRRTNSFVHYLPAGNGKVTRGVAMVLHGLNVKPASMQSIIRQLTEMGIETIRCALRGHGDNFEPHPDLTVDQARMRSFRAVSDDLWRQEFRAAYQVAAARSRALGGAPLYFIGYSLGGLLGCEVVLRDDDVAFDRLVLFAPALSIPIYGYLFLPLAPFPALTIPSFTPARHRANPSTPVAGYIALYRMAACVGRTTLATRLNVPTLLFVDRGDELVSASKIAAMVESRALTRWRIEFIEKDESATERYRHLIIDEEAVGKTTWAKMMAAMRTHLAALGEPQVDGSWRGSPQPRV